MAQRFGIAWAAYAVALLVAATGCGSDDGAGNGTGSTVAQSELGGSYQLAKLIVEGDEPAGSNYGATVRIDAEFGALRIETACGDLLGSFSLLPDGRAGITVAGGTTRPCVSADAAVDELLVRALGRVDSWSDSEPGIRLESPSGDLIELAR